MSTIALTFPQIFRTCLAAFGGTKQQLARAIRITPSSLSHLAAGHTGPSVEVCLRLAAASGVPASRILIAAGKTEIAHLLEALYGSAGGSRILGGLTLSPDERELVEKLRLVRPRSRRAVRTLIDAAAFANGALELPPHHKSRRLPARRAAG